MSERDMSPGALAAYLRDAVKAEKRMVGIQSLDASMRRADRCAKLEAAAELLEQMAAEQVARCRATYAADGMKPQAVELASPGQNP